MYAGLNVHDLPSLNKWLTVAQDDSFALSILDYFRACFAAPLTALSANFQLARLRVED